MLRGMVISNPIIESSFSSFCFLTIDILEHTYCVSVTAIFPSMDTKFVNNEEIVSDTCRLGESFLTASVHNDNV